MKQALRTLEPKFMTVRQHQTTVKFYHGASKQIKTYPWRWPFLDIFTGFHNRTHIWNSFDNKRREKNRIMPFTKRPLEGYDVFAPKDMYYYLKAFHYDIEKCMIGNYNHRHETPRKGMPKFPCKEVKDYAPWVYRRIVNGKMEETLKFRDKVIHTKLLDYDGTSEIGPYETFFP